MEAKEYQIGEVFRCEGLRLVCVESENCDDCCMDCDEVYCGTCVRDDGKPVKFIKIEENLIESQSETINWEQRRYELSMAAMQGILADSTVDSEDEKLCKACIAVADEMIKQLKQPIKH